MDNFFSQSRQMRILSVLSLTNFDLAVVKFGHYTVFAELMFHDIILDPSFHGRANIIDVGIMLAISVIAATSMAIATMMVRQ